MRVEEKVSRSLDGWRGISILLVVTSHLIPIHGVFNGACGRIGMTMFFILSGFLIGYCLDRSSSLGLFLRHRAARILPAYWLLLMIAVAIQRVTPAGALVHFFFRANRYPYFWALEPGVAHLWSLAVEVHFYLFAAFGYWVVGRRFAFWFAASFLAACFASSFAANGFFAIPTEFRLSSCALGLFLHACWRANNETYRRLFASRLWLLALVPMAWLHSDVFDRLEGLGVLAVALVFANLVTVRSVRLLSWFPLRYLGFIAYPLYLIHGLLGPIIPRLSHVPGFLSALPSLFLSVVLAHLSAYFFEPRFHSRRIPPRRDRGTEAIRSIIAENETSTSPDCGVPRAGCPSV